MEAEGRIDSPQHSVVTATTYLMSFPPTFTPTTINTRNDGRIAGRTPNTTTPITITATHGFYAPVLRGRRRYVSRPTGRRRSQSVRVLFVKQQTKGPTRVIRPGGLPLWVFNDMVPGIGVECVCLSGAMIAKAGTVLDVCLVGRNRLRSRHGNVNVSHV